MLKTVSGFADLMELAKENPSIVTALAKLVRFTRYHVSS